MIHSLKASAVALGLAILAGSLTCGCGEAINSPVHNKANLAPQNQDNQTATAEPAAAFFTLRNYKVVANSATAAGPAQINPRDSALSSSPPPSRDSSLNHWQLE